MELLNYKNKLRISSGAEQLLIANTQLNVYRKPN
jgi:hypothetical protein